MRLSKFRGAVDFSMGDTKWAAPPPPPQTTLENTANTNRDHIEGLELRYPGNYPARSLHQIPSNNVERVLVVLHGPFCGPGLMAASRPAERSIASATDSESLAGDGTVGEL